ncbi:MAG TPA: PQQ-binding-like beta-propeller repeat protein [Candidatus Acidoferrum sp.]|jgi:outer membrane protein assembly factor BamB|nr:PQQ-binding-like beta-propeller repeat protein [Candidatus Acidoferrum sp.]
MKLDALLSVIVAAASFATSGATPAWPGFRGPNSSGVAAEATPPISISPTNSVLWNVKVPWSPSSPCIWGDQIFLTTFNDHELQTRCYHRRDGALTWSQGLKPVKLETFHSTENSPAATTPATDGQRVVSYFGSFGLICYDRKGTELWRHPLPVALSGGGYGTTASPLIAGNLVVVDRDQDEGSSLLAVELATGKTAWETPRPDAHGSFGTPILWRNNGVEEVITPGSLRLKGYALKTGLEDWMVQGTTAFACTTPVVGDGLLFFAAWCDGKADAPWPTWEKFLEEHDRNKDGVVTLDEFDAVSRDFWRGLDLNRDGKIDKAEWDEIQANIAKGENVLVAVNPGGRGDISQSHVAWKVTRGLPYVASPLFYDGRIYLIKNGGMLSSFEAKTGKPYYVQERLDAPGSYYSSPVAGGGRIYLASSAGKLTVVKAGGEKPEILHQAEFGERIFASPALVGDKLYLRTQSTLYAFGPKTVH